MLGTAGDEPTQKRDGHPARNPGVVGFEGPPDRGARGVGGRASAQLGAGQHEQLEAAFERRVEEEARAPRSLRGKSGKKSGGQEGHAGDTLRQVAQPDFVVPHEACVCRHCRLPLDPKAPIAIEKRQVFDLPERLLLVTEHQASTYRCANCRGVTRAAFPEGVVSPAQYGERFKAAAVYLNVQQLIPEDRTAQTMSDIFGAPRVCSASVVAWVGEKAEELTPVYERIGERVAGEKVRHLDETGYRIGGKLQWLHTTSSLCFTFYRAGEKRGDIPRNLKGGVVVHDHFKPYNGLVEVIHAFCNAHILRELEGLIEFEKEPWAELMRAMLREANEAVRAAREAGKRALPTEQVEAFVDRYWAAVRMGLAYHRGLPALETKSKTRGRRKQRPGHNLLDRLKKFKTETLRFLSDFDVPFTNNLAEQDLRMMKVKMKISGGFRTLEGADFRAPQVRRVDREGAGFQHPASPHRDPRAAHAISRRLTVGRSHAARARRGGGFGGTECGRTERGDAAPSEPTRKRRVAGKIQNSSGRRSRTPRTFATSPQQAAPHPMGRRPAVARPPTHRPPPTAPGLGVTAGRRAGTAHFRRVALRVTG